MAIHPLVPLPCFAFKKEGTKFLAVLIGNVIPVKTLSSLQIPTLSVETVILGQIDWRWFITPKGHKWLCGHWKICCCGCWAKVGAEFGSWVKVCSEGLEEGPRVEERGRVVGGVGADGEGRIDDN